MFSSGAAKCLIFIIMVLTQTIVFGQNLSPASDSAAVFVAPKKILIVKILQKGGGGPIRKVEVSLGDRKFYTDPDGLVDVELPGNATEIAFVKTGVQLSSLQWD